MREETWFKMIAISALLHVLIVGAFSVQLKKSGTKIDLPYYSVNLVGDIGGGAGAAPEATAKSEPPAKARAAEPRKPKPTIQPKEKARSIAPKQKEKERPIEVKKKEPVKTTRNEVKSVEQKIREMRKKTQYLDVVGNGTGTGRTASSSSGSAGSGSGTLLDPAMQNYIDLLKERLQEVWKPPMGLKDLQTVVTIRIRKDGQITDWTIDERSASRAYDESVTRALRSVERLPPPPGSQDTEIPGFRFLPPQR